MILMEELVYETGELKLNGDLWLGGIPRPCFCNPKSFCNRKTCKSFIGPRKMADGKTGFELCDCNVVIKADGFMKETA